MKVSSHFCPHAWPSIESLLAGVKAFSSRTQVSTISLWQALLPDRKSFGVPPKNFKIDIDEVKNR
jgi:hypothetical protein